MSVCSLSPWPVFEADEIQQVEEILLSGRVNQWTGDQVVKFNEEFANWCGVDFAIGLANGTLALEAALRACGVGVGDEVIVTPRTFIASASSVNIIGATPVFCDVDRVSGNVTADTIAPHITSRTKAIIAVHLAGWPCEMAAIMDMARSCGIYVIEDCAQAHGGMHQGRRLGGWGHVAAWSFCQDKIMSTGGEGGAVTTNDSSLWSEMWAYKDHGKSFVKTRDPAPPSGFRWLHDSIGSNSRMMEIQAAIGRLQLRKMERWHIGRTKNASMLHDAVLSAGDVARSHRTGELDVHAYYRFYAYVNPIALADGWCRNRIISRAGELGLPLFQGTCPEVYLERAFDLAPGRPPERLPVARELGETSLMALVHPTITEIEMGRCAQILKQVLQEAQR